MAQCRERDVAEKIELMFGLTHDLNTDRFSNYSDSGFTYFTAVTPDKYRNLDNPYTLATHYHLAM
jgi:hypothetical protein